MASEWEDKGSFLLVSLRGVHLLLKGCGGVRGVGHPGKGSEDGTGTIV